MFAGDMDKQWIHNPNRCADDYLDVLNQFIDFVIANNRGSTEIRCPCRKCNNSMIEYFEIVRYHIVINEMIEIYTTWNHHGEQIQRASSSHITRSQWRQLNLLWTQMNKLWTLSMMVFQMLDRIRHEEVEDDVSPTMDSEAFEKYENY